MGTVDTVECRGVDGAIEIGMLRPRPVSEGLRSAGVGDMMMEGVPAPALARSASAIFSAVSCGTAGIGLAGAVGFPNVIILGCARTETGTGAVAMIAVDRYA